MKPDPPMAQKHLKEMRKLKHNYKRAMKMKGKVSFKDDILRINMRRVSYSAHGFKVYKISPPIISVRDHIRGKGCGFDLYVSGRFNHELSLVACYAKLGDWKYAMVKLYELTNTSGSSAEAEMAVRSIEQKYLRERCRYEIINTKF
jgi:hypothetical protein